MSWKIGLIAATVVFGSLAQAAPVRFTGCSSEIVTEVFGSCRDGEGGSSEPCSSKKTKWGDTNTTLEVDARSLKATATVDYKPVGGKSVRLATVCGLDPNDDAWIDCETVKPVATLGKLHVTFNKNGIGPDVYFVDIFADATNVPVGAFQTETDCRKN